MFNSGELDAVLDLLISDVDLPKAKEKELQDIESNNPLNEPLIKRQASVDKESLTIMKGALRAMWASVSTIASPMNRVFMIADNTPANKENMKRIVQSGHSRIPIYDSKNSNNIKGIVLVKQLLIQYNPSLTPRTFQDFINVQPLYFSPNLNVLGALNQFQLGNSHFGFLRRKNSGVLTGMITFEDVIELLIQKPIDDESGKPSFRRSKNCSIV